jgi:2'-5' RNA ligase
MNDKTHTTAVVLIPPSEVWPPLQAIRQQHDRHFRRWMPHITLLYPFRPRAEFDGLAARFAEVCTVTKPFRVDLTDMRIFRHGRAQYTLWLAPEPRDTLCRLQTTLASVVPECDDVTRHRDGFTPHLSIGQIQGEVEMAHLRQALQATWRPLTFMAQAVSLICRDEPPHDVFRVVFTVQLGRGE